VRRDVRRMGQLAFCCGLLIMFGLTACSRTTIDQSGPNEHLCAGQSNCPGEADSSPAASPASGSGSGSSAATGSAAPISTQSADTAPPPRLPQYLAQAQFGDTNAANVGTGQATIDKGSYLNSIWLCSDLEVIANINCDSDSSPSWVDYNVPAGYSHFAATIGYSNDSPSNCDVIVQIFGDGHQLYDREMFYGNSLPVRYDVGNYQRIRLEIKPKQGMMCNTVFGNAEFTA
jgi:hypothetical protein